MNSLITVDELRRLMPQLSLADAGTYAPLLDAAMREFSIDNKRRRCAFLANLAHESQQLTRWEENLNYKAPRLMEVFDKYFNPNQARQYAHKPKMIAARVYANRMGNGNEESGDGWTYRGRGPIGLTGKTNYLAYSHLLRINLVGDPDLAAHPEHGFRIAAAFWNSRKLNALADHLNFKGDKDEREVFIEITISINGGMNGLTDRLNYFRVAKQVLHGDEVPDGHEPTAAPGLPTAVQAESPAEVSPDTDVDLLGAAVSSERAKAAGTRLWPRLVRHFTFALGWAEAMYQAHKFGSVVVTLLIAAVIGWVLYHNRKRLTPIALKLLK